MLIRYPGGKRKLRKLICDKMGLLISQSSCDVEYAEPFFGGGDIGTTLIKDGKIKKAKINDKDSGVACLWTCVACYPEEMKKRVMEYVPRVEDFYSITGFLQNESPDLEDANSILDFGFSKMVIHQISYSGLGLKSGGPLGGRDQKSKYKIDCRWSPEYICNKIDEMHKLLRSVGVHECSSKDFSVIIGDDSCESVLYLDPPYYDKGSDLYHESFTEEDHIRLANCLKATKHKWLLSYDDCSEVRGLYDWANIETVDRVNYSITSKKVSEEGKRESRWKNEVLIYPKGIM